MRFSLPPLDAVQAPLFKAAADCSRWIASLPFATPVKAQADLLTQLKLLNRYPVEARERMAILEALLPALRSLQEQAAERYAGKRVPLDPGARFAFDTTDALWQELAFGYLRCVEVAMDSGQAAARPVARALAAMYALQRARAAAREVLPARHWGTLHDLMLVAERNGVASAVLEDPILGGQSSPLAAYAASLLLHAAGPQGLRPAQLAWVDRWVRRWCHKTQLTRTLSTDSKALPLCLDLSCDQPAGYQPASGEQARFLDTEELRKSIGSRLVLLEQGKSPAELRLGEDCSPQASAELLKRLNQVWCRGGNARRPERARAGSGGRLMADPEAIHRFLSNGMSLMPKIQMSLQELRKQREAMAVFGNTQGVEMTTISKRSDPALEDNWTVFDENATGLRLERPIDQGKTRLGVGQLVAVQPPGVRHLVLASVAWVSVSSDAGVLQLGLSLFPAPVIAIAIKNAGLNADKEPMKPGFLLPALAPANEPPSIILPVGRFRVGRSTAFQDQTGDYQVRLTRLLNQGDDYERAGYEAVTG